MARAGLSTEIFFIKCISETKELKMMNNDLCDIVIQQSSVS